MTMDRIGRLRGSAEVADDAFQESMARLSVHLATRRPTHALPDLQPPRQPIRIGWPYALLAAIVGVGAVGYPAYTWLMRDGAPRAAPPAPVLAAVAVAPEPAAPPAPPSLAPKAEAAAPVDVLAAIPPPPPPAPPISLPAPAETTVPQPDIALNRAEIVEVQNRLASLGIDPGPIDGIAGPRTAAGVEAYETRAGRAVTGKADRGLLARLRQGPR
jgi:hypothetical protein